MLVFPQKCSIAECKPPLSDHYAGPLIRSFGLTPEKGYKYMSELVHVRLGHCEYECPKTRGVVRIRVIGGHRSNTRNAHLVELL